MGHRVWTVSEDPCGRRQSYLVRIDHLDNSHASHDLRQFPYKVYAELSIHIGEYTGFDHPPLESADVEMCQNVHWSH